MTVNELGKKLKEMYVSAPKGEKVTMSLVFGIKYHDHIKNVGVKGVIEESGLPKNYSTELSKAVKLVKYVSLIK